MKKLISLILILALLIPAAALADLPDISDLSFRELVLLRKTVLYALWECREWQEVTVQPGVWEIGVEIPAGHWTITPADGCGPDYVIYASATKNQGHDVDIMAGEYIMECVCSETSVNYSGEYKTCTDIEMEAGHFVRLDCVMVFSPFIGKPVFDFH